MPAILERLVRQLMAKGKSKSQAYAIATATLQKRGVLKPGTRKLTKKGAKRNRMGAAGRAKSRAAKYSGRKPGDYKYNKRTNRATLKKKRR